MSNTQSYPKIEKLRSTKLFKLQKYVDSKVEHNSGIVNIGDNEYFVKNYSNYNDISIGNMYSNCEEVIAAMVLNESFNDINGLSEMLHANDVPVIAGQEINNAQNNYSLLMIGKNIKELKLEENMGIYGVNLEKMDYLERRLFFSKIFNKSTSNIFSNNIYSLFENLHQNELGAVLSKNTIEKYDAFICTSNISEISDVVSQESKVGVINSDDTIVIHDNESILHLD